MSALFQIEEHRVIEQTVRITDPAGLPQFGLFRVSTHLIKPESSVLMSDWILIYLI